MPIYYTHIDKLPIENWFLLQDGKFDALYKIKLFKRIPDFFRQIEYDMNFQFERINLDRILKLKDIVLLESIGARKNDNVKKFYAAQKWKEYLAELNRDKDIKKQTMNQMFNFIEKELKCFGTCHGKMPTSRVYSLYYLALDEIKPKLKNVS